LDFAINLSAAKALGTEFTPNLLALADEVIEYWRNVALADAAIGLLQVLTTGPGGKPAMPAAMQTFGLRYPPNFCRNDAYMRASNGRVAL
jgi:hypothetical protein